MGRAKRRCAKPDCRNFQPCKLHRSNWSNYEPREPLPSNWKSLRRAVKNRSGGRCEAVLSNGFIKYRCNRPSDSVDHIIPRSQWPSNHDGLHWMSNLQDLCKACHTMKTSRE